MAGGRRVYHWPAGLSTIVFALLGVWMVVAAKQRTGLTVDSPPDLRRTGTARVESCSADALYMWLTSRCSARVQWDGESVGEVRAVRAGHDLPGTVPVVEREVVRRGPDMWEVVAAD